MSEATTEEPLNTRSQECHAIRRRLQEWQVEDYVLPGWQIVWDGERGCFVARFQMVHHPVPYTLGELEFEMYALGFADRRAAVMARRPRQETATRRRKPEPDA